MTRRQALGVLTAGATTLAAQPDLTRIVKHHDATLENLLQRPLGGINGIYSARFAATVVEQCTAAYLYPDSKFHADNLMVERIRAATNFLNRIQHPDGFIDLLETNFDSPPDTGFTVHNLATGACLAQRAGHRELVALSEPFLRKAGEGLIVGGIHTPNHRWVVSSALAQLNELFPDPRYLNRIDQWLAEGIDIDADGQFTERSTTVYNTVCDRAFVVLAAKLKRPELLDPVRQNLNSMLYLMHADYEVVTEISRRQDRNQRGNMGGYWFPLRYLAAHDHNGKFATIVNHFTPGSASLSTIMEYPEIAGPLPDPEPLPSDFRMEMLTLGIVRFRRGPVSATVLSDDPTFFTLRNGAAVIQAVRFASAFFGKGQFTSPKIEDGLALTQHLEAPYYQPLDPPRKVTPANWSTLRKERATSQVCHLEQSAQITQTPNGFSLRIQSHGTPGVPLAIEISFREGGQLDASNGTYTVGPDRIRFGPDLHQHNYTNIRGALPKMEGQSFYLTAFTPVDHTLNFTFT